MPVDITKQDANIGEVVYQWTVKEYEKFEHNNRWYWVMSILGLALVAYAIIAANYLFALIIVLFGIIMFLFEAQEPLEVPFAITKTGIIIGKKYFRYSEIKNFWIIYNPPEVKNLYFGTEGIIHHRLQVSLMDFDPRPIREYLNQFLIEDLDQEDEPMGDRLTRTLQLH